MRKKSLLLVLVILVLAVMMISCGKKEKVDIEESITILHNIAIKQDSTGFEKVGITQEEVDKILEEQKRLTIKILKTTFANEGIIVSNDELEKVYVARGKALKKLSVKVETINSNSKVANVKVGTTYIEENLLCDKAANDAVEMLQNEVIDNENDIKNKLVELYINNVIEELNNAEASISYAYINSQFKLVNGVWEPEDFDGYIKELANISSK